MITKTQYKSLNKAISEYIKAFIKKQEMDFDYWLSDEIGGTACFGSEWMFSFNDIRLDLETNQPKHRILEWYEDSLNLYEHTGYDNPYKAWLLAKGYISYQSDNPHEEANFKINIAL